jgi:hypothetical protein
MFSIQYIQNLFDYSRVRFHYDLTEAPEAYDAGTNFDFVAHSEIQKMGLRKYIFATRIECNFSNLLTGHL